jgi:uncharacterized protein (DUF433 family)
MLVTESRHIQLDPGGNAVIAGTTMKVIELATEHRAWKLDAEALQAGHPYLSLAQVYAALSYYYDHQIEYDAEMDRRDAEYQARRSATELPASLRKLR